MKRQKEYERNGIFELNKVVPFIVNDGKFRRNYIGYDGKIHPIKMGSKRNQLFKKRGVVCKHCGLKGIYFAMERHLRRNGKPVGDTFHFSLYGINQNGEEIMMTVDHIIPKSRGGRNMMKNYQPLCRRCNVKKGCN